MKPTPSPRLLTVFKAAKFLRTVAKQAFENREAITYPRTPEEIAQANRANRAATVILEEQTEARRPSPSRRACPHEL